MVIIMIKITYLNHNEKYKNDVIKSALSTIIVVSPRIELGSNL